jgi:sugar lactone lactonase YvrE
MHKTSSSIPQTQRKAKKLIALGWKRGTAVLLACALLIAPQLVVAQAPSVVATTQSALTTTTGINSGQTAVDACGNLYVNPTSGNIVQILAATGAVKTISTNTNSYNNGPAIAIDPAKANLYYVSSSQWYSDAFTKVPITGCTLGTPQVVAPSTGCPTNQYYYGTSQFLAPDASGNVFFVPSACNTLIYEQPATGKVVTVLATWPKSLTSLAVDSAGNVYFTDGSTNVSMVKPPFPGTAVTIAGGFAGPSGVSVDAQGNLLISDKTASLLYEIPNEGGVLNPADQFAVSSITLTNAVSSDLSGNYYTSNASGPLAIRQSLKFANTALGTSSSAATVGYVFNAPLTPASIAARTGSQTSAAFAVVSGGTCVPGTAYAAGKSCTVAVTYTPTLAELQRSALVMSNGSGAPLNEFAVSGTGLGAAATVDPGTLTKLGSGFVSPNAVAAGPDGTVYVADSTANTVTMFASGSTTGTALGTGTLSLSSPGGIAVDGAGDVYIADTGNSRIVEVPVLNGALTPASSTAYTAQLKGPTGLAFSASGNLYIADTGNKRLLFVPYRGGVLNFGIAQAYGSGFSTPSSVTVDPSGNVFVADSGNNVVYEFPAPLGSAAQAAVVTGLSAPTAVAADSSNGLFVVDTGNFNVYRYPNNAGTLGTRSIVGNGIANPVGVAVDPSGNLFVTDATNKVVDELLRSQGQLAFGVENVGTPSSSLSATINSSGTQALTFPSPPYSISGNTTAGFSVTSDGCGSAGTVAAGGSCAISAQFTPPAVAPLATETLTLKSNSAPSGQTIVLSGTGRIITVPTISLALTNPSSSQGLTATQPVTFTATIGTGAGTATPGGTLKLFVNGNQAAVAAVAGTAVQISLPNGLPDGNVTIAAVYSGDQLNYSGATGSLTLIVAALPTGLTLTVTPGSAGTSSILYTNPLSVSDYAGNANGPALALTATLTTSSTVIAAGLVTFYYGSGTNPTTLGTASVTVTGSGVYQATVQISALRAGTANIVENNAFLTTYNLFAVYTGDTTYGTSTSPSVPLSVVGAPANCGTTAAACSTPPLSGATFSIAPVNSTITITSSTITGQGSGSATLNVTSYGGWTGVLTFTCAGLPAYAKCTTYPGVPQINATTGSAPVATNQVQLTIATNVQPSNTTAASLPWQIAGLSGLILLWVRRKLNFATRKRLTLVVATLLLAAAGMSVSGCGSGTAVDVTPAGTTTVTVYVQAAQLNTTNATTYANDVNTPSFQIQLVVR